MEQLIMQTQQSADLKPKASAKKTQNSREKQSDFGKALEEQAASYAQASAAAGTSQPQQTAQAEPQAETAAAGLTGVQANGVIGTMTLQAWLTPQQAALTQDGQQAQLPQQAEVHNLTDRMQPQTAQAEPLGAMTAQILQTAAQTSVKTEELAASKLVKPQEAVQTEVQNVQTDQTAQEDHTALVKAVSDADDTAASVAAKTDDKAAQTDVSAFKPQYSEQQLGMQIGDAENTAKTAEMKPEYADMLKDMIAKQISSGKQELEIQLTPRSLGELTVKVSYHDGAAAVSIICSDKKALQAMSQKAGELGLILENNLGTKTAVIVETREEQTQLYQDGRGQQSYQEQQNSEQQQNKKQKETETIDFLQQLRLGIRKESTSIWQ